MRTRVSDAVVLRELQRRDDVGAARVPYLQRRDARRLTGAERNSARAEDPHNENPTLDALGKKRFWAKLKRVSDASVA